MAYSLLVHQCGLHHYPQNHGNYLLQNSRLYALEFIAVNLFRPSYADETATHTIALQATDPEDPTITAPPPKLFYRVKVNDTYDNDTYNITNSEKHHIGFNQNYPNDDFTMMALSHYTESDKDGDGVKDCEELAARKDMASPVSYPPIRYNVLRNSSSRFSASSYSGGPTTRVTFSRW